MIMMIMMKKYVLIALFFNEQTCTIGSVHEMLRVGARSTVLLAKLWLCSTNKRGSEKCLIASEMDLLF